MVVAAAAVRPETVDGILLYTGSALAVVFWVTVVVLVLIPVGAIVGGTVLAWAFISKRRNENMRQRDGSKPLQKIDPRKPVVFIDTDQMVGSAGGWIPGVGWVEFDGGAGWENQLAVARQRSLVSRVQAAIPGDTAIVKAADSLRNVGGAGGFLSRILKGDRQMEERVQQGWDNAPRLPGRQSFVSPAASSTGAPPTVTVEQPEPLQLPVLADLVRESRPTSVVFGQNPETGELATWDLQETPHMRLHGGTQKGKTSAAKTIVAGLLAHEAQVVILNPKAGVWAPAAEFAEVADVRRPEVFLQALRCVHAEFVRRDQLLTQRGAQDIMALRPSERPPRLIVVVEEYGAQRFRAQAAGTLEEVDQYMSVLASEAAAAGVHVVAVDQRPTNYHPFVKANLGAVVVFNLPDDGAGKAAGYARAHRLGRYHFYFEGDIYRSVDSADFERVVRRASPVRYPPVLVEPAAEPQSVSRSVSANAFPGVSPEVGHTETVAGNTENGADMGKWYEFILDYMSRSDGRGLWETPARGVRDLARVMSRTETGSEQAEDAYVGIASKVAKRIRAEAMLSNGNPLGTDVTVDG